MHPRPSDCLLSSDQDVQQDALDIASLRHHLRGAEIAGKVALKTLLTEHELQRLPVYVQKYQNLDSKERCKMKDLVVHIGDNPRDGGWLNWSAKSHAIPTLRRSTSLYIAVQKARQVTLKELYALMGFPTYACLAEAANVELFDPLRYRSWSDARKQLGNGMHVCCIGVLLSTWMAAFKKRP